MSAPSVAPSWRSDRAQMAGIETVPFGILVFVAGTLLVVNAWAAVTNRTTANSIAREYLRAYTNAPTRLDALEAGERAALAVAGAHHLSADRVHIDTPTEWRACGIVAVTVTIAVPEIRAPFLGGFGTDEIRVEHRDRLDRYRAGLDPESATDACE